MMRRLFPSSRAATSPPAVKRAVQAGAIATSAVIVLGGCSWHGLNSVPLPGAAGRGDGAFEVQVHMPDVTTLTRNSPVRIGDVEVGSITDIVARDYEAVLTLSLDKEVKLPANAWAKVGQTSLLGSQHLELTPPPEERPTGTLGDGDVIPIERAGTYPTTDQTLAALSVVLSGGGLQQIEDIAHELNQALDDGRVTDAKAVIGELNDTVTSLDNQRDSIVEAIEGLDRLSGTVAEQNDTLGKALTQMPEATTLLRDQRDQLTGALVGLGDLGNRAATVANLAGPELVDNLNNLMPILTQLADTGRNLTRVMNILITFPFPQNGMDNFLKGDFANLYIDADLTVDRLDETFRLGTDMGNRMAGLEGVVGLAPAPMSSADPYAMEVPDGQQHYSGEGPGEGAPAADGDPAGGAPAPAPAPNEGAQP